MSMTDEIKKEAREVEDKIKILLNEFEDKTGVAVYNITFDRIYQVGVLTGEITQIQLEIRI